MKKLLYGDFEEQYTNYETAAIAILPVAYDGTSTWLKGADKGPQAILEASPNMEFYDIETDSEVFKQGIATLDMITENTSPEAMAHEVEVQIDQILKEQKISSTIGRRTFSQYRRISSYCEALRYFFHFTIRRPLRYAG